MKKHLTPSLAVAVLALVLAAAGAGYAGGMITSAQIKDHTIQAVDIKAKTITGQEIKSASVPSSALKKDCAATALKVAGVCFIKKTNAIAPLQTAINHCHSLGGRIASYAEIRLMPTVNGVGHGVTWSTNMLSQYEYTSTYVLDSTLNVVTSDYAGNVLTNDMSNRGYHCVTFP